MARVTIVQGPSRSGKTQAVLDRYREHARSRGVASVLLLLPHPGAVEQARRALLADGDLPGLFGPRVMTFPELASILLDENGATATEVAPVGQRLLLREAVRRVREDRGLPYLQPVADFEGLLDVLAEFIEELKRGAISETQFAERVGAAGLDAARDGDLAAIFTEYQGILHASNLFDAAGRFWWALEVLRAGRRRPFDKLSRMLVHGFDDFTPTQLEAIELLSRPVDEIVFTLGIEDSQARPELFEVPRETLDRLRAAFGTGNILRLPPEDADASPLAALRARLFSAPGETRPTEGAVRVIEAPARSREVREIARETKRLLLDESLGAGPGDIALVFRSLPCYAPLLRSAFREFGVPLHVAHPEPVGQSPLGKTVLQMLRLVAEDFPRELLVSFLRSTYVRLPEHGASVADHLDRFARAAGVIGGREQWRERLRSHHDRLRWRVTHVGDGEDPERAQRAAEAAERDLPLLEQSIGLADSAIKELLRLARAQSLGQAIATIRGLIDHFGVGVFFRGSGPDAASTAARRDVLALDALLDTLDDLTIAAAEVGQNEGPLAASELLAVLTDALENATYSPDGRHEGKIRALEAHQARQLRFRFVFIGGLLEREFPRRQRESQLYRDDERAALAKSGLNLQQRLERQSEEMHLFHEAVSSATERLYLTYPVTDDEGREVLPSPFVDEVRAVFGDWGVGDRRRVRPADVSASLDEAHTRAELLEATWEGLWGRAQAEPQSVLTAYNALIGATGRGPACAAWGAYVETRRDSRAPFDQYGAVLADDAVLAGLAQQFGPQHRFSPKVLSEYGSCPFTFFGRRVLHLEPLQDPAEEVEATTRGDLYHEVLSRFFRRTTDEGGIGPVTENLAEAHALMDSVVTEVFEEESRRAVATNRTLLEIEREECQRSMACFLGQEADEFAGRRPTLFEAGFGLDDSDQPLQIGAGEEQVLVRGRVDRVDIITDVGAGANRGEPDLIVGVVDYKTGKAAPASAIVLGTDLQLPLYALAAETILFAPRAARCADWAYRIVRRPVEAAGRTLDHRRITPEDIAALATAARTHALAFAAAIRAGKFPPGRIAASDGAERLVAPVDAVCRYCDFRALCRFEEGVALEKLRSEVPDG